MISNVINMMNRKPMKLQTYEIDITDMWMLLETVLSPINGESPVSLKIIYHEGELRCFITTSVTLSKSIENPLLMNDFNIYQIQLNSNNFFPLSTKSNLNLIENIQKITKIYEKTDNFMVNILLKRRKSLKNMFLSQYEQYIHGVDNPSSNSLMSHFQSTFINENDIRILPSPFIDAIENKILDTHLEFQIFFAFMCKSSETELESLDMIEDNLTQYSYLNSLSFQEISVNPSDALNGYHFSQPHVKNYISLKEMFFLVDGNRFGRMDSDHISENTDISMNPIIQPNKTFQEAQSAKMNDPISGKTEHIDSLNIIELLPLRKNSPSKLNDELSHQIIESLNRTNITKDKMELDEIKQGATTTKIMFYMPKNINLTNITKKSEDIKAALGINNLTITQGDKPNTVSFYIPNEKREILFLKKMLKDKSFNEFIDNHPLPYVIGENDSGEIIFACLTQMPHLLVAGTTGSGKSAWLNQLILTFILVKNPLELMIYIIDPKQVEFQHLKGVPHVADVFTDIKQSYKFIMSLVDEMERRYELMSKKGYRHISTYNQNQLEKIPYLVCAIDEYADLKTQFPEIEKGIKRLGQKSRSAGIHLIVATQRPDKDVISKTLQSNLASTICFRLKTSYDYQTVFGKKQPYQLMGKGHGVMSLEGQMKEYVQFQGACVSDSENEEMETIQKIKDYYSGKNINVPKHEVIDVEEHIEEDIAEEPIDQLKRIIANTGETVSTQLQKDLGISMNKVLLLMKDLVDEGWLYKHAARSKGYKLIATEDMLNEWRDEPVHYDTNTDKDVDVESEDNMNIYHDENKLSENELKMKIDEALKNRDEEGFMKYTKMLKELKDE